MRYHNIFFAILRLYFWSIHMDKNLVLATSFGFKLNSNLKFVNRVYPESQFGFRDGRFFYQQGWSFVRQLLVKGNVESSKDHSSSLQVFYLTKAFHLVSIYSLFKILAKISFPSNALRGSVNLSTRYKQKRWWLIDDPSSVELTNNSGFKQGWVLALTLFVILSAVLLCAFGTSTDGIYL